MKPTELEFQELRKNATQWAAEVLNDPSVVIVDTETTGLLSKNPDTEVCQLSAINVWGRPVFSMLIKPATPVPQEVINIHGITNEQLIGQPTFPQIAKLLSHILEGKHVICYNSDFDVKLIWHLYRKYKIELPKVTRISCAMDKYSEFKGEWNESKGNLKWHKLPKLAAGEAHDSLVDCVSTLKLIQLIAGDYNPADVEADEISLDF